MRDQSHILYILCMTVLTEETISGLGLWWQLECMTNSEWKRCTSGNLAVGGVEEAEMAEASGGGDGISTQSTKEETGVGTGARRSRCARGNIKTFFGL